MGEEFPSDAILTGLSGGTGDTGLLHMTIDQDPWYVDGLKLSDFLDRVLRWTANALRVAKDDSADLKFLVYPGRFLAAAGQVDYAGASAQAVVDDAINYIYLTAAGVLTVNQTGFPADGTEYIPLATIGCGTSSGSGATGFRVSDVVDCRVPFSAIAASPAESFDLSLRELARNGDFGLSDGGWSSGALTLRGMPARSGAVYSLTSLEITLPGRYVAGTDLTLTARCRAAGSDSKGTCSAEIQPYSLDDDGTPTLLTATIDDASLPLDDFGDLVWTLDGSALVAGSRIHLLIRTLVTETGNAGDLRAEIGRLQIDMTTR